MNYNVDYEKARKNMAFMAAFFAGLLAILLGLTVRDKKQLKAEAVQRGFATWVSDENGNTHFEWKKPTQ